MSIAASTKPEFQRLPEAATKHLGPLGRWFETTATFIPFETYFVCADNVLLVDKSHEVRKHLESLIKGSSTAEVRITALKFTKPATIPMKAGSTVDLIPVKIGGIPFLDGEELRIGDFVRLTGETPATLSFGQSNYSEEPVFYCILLLSQ